MPGDKQGRQAFAWAYFDRNPTAENATCKRCFAVLKCVGGSTSGLIRHLKTMHNISQPPKESQDPTADSENDSASSRLQQW